MPQSMRTAPGRTSAPPHQVGRSGRHDDDLGPAQLCPQVDRLPMADGHGRVLPDEHELGRAADDVAASDDDGRSAGEGDPIGTQDDERRLRA